MLRQTAAILPLLIPLSLTPPKKKGAIREVAAHGAPPTLKKGLRQSRHTVAMRDLVVP